MHFRWYPSIPCSRSPGGGGIPACLAAFQAQTQGEVEGDLARGVSRPITKGEVEGDLARGVSRPTPKGEVEGDLAWGVPVLGWVCSGEVWRPPMWRQLLRAVRILLECILIWFYLRYLPTTAWKWKRADASLGSLLGSANEKFFSFFERGGDVLRFRADACECCCVCLSVSYCVSGRLNWFTPE